MLELFFEKKKLSKIDAKEIAALEEAVLKKCEAMLQHKPLLEIIASKIQDDKYDDSKPEDACLSRDDSALKHISAGLLSILKGSDETARNKLLNSLINEIKLDDNRYVVKFKIPGQK